MPAGFRSGHDGDLACPHRDKSCCVDCADRHVEIVEVCGQHFWIGDPAEREKLIKECHASDGPPPTPPLSLVNQLGLEIRRLFGERYGVAVGRGLLGPTVVAGLVRGVAFELFAAAESPTVTDYQRAAEWLVAELAR